MDRRNGRKTLFMAFAAMLAPLALIGLVSVMMLQFVVNGRISLFEGTMFLIIVPLMILFILFMVVKWQIDKRQGLMENLDQAAEEKLAEQEGRLAEQRAELEDIMRSMNGMAGSLEQIITSVKSETSSLREVSDGFTQSFQEMADSLEQVSEEVNNMEEHTIFQSGQMDEFSSRIMEMNRAAHGITGQVDNLAGSTDKIREYGESAGQVMKELVNLYKTGGKAAGEMQMQTDRTYHSVMQISTVTEIISKISSQANLAALNASIEASKAGEKGKGFALVADEIRSLADQSRDSLEQVNAIVSELINHANENVGASQNMADAQERQARKISQAGEIVASLEQELEQICYAISGIASETAEWETEQEVIDTDIVSLPQAAEEKAANNKQIDQIGRFKITDFRK